jgi:hypothetical protein
LTELVLCRSTPETNRFSVAHSQSHFQSHFGVQKKYVEFLDVSDSLTTIQPFRITSGQLSLAGAPNLTHLDLSKSKEALSDLKGLSAISRSCPKLTVLNLFGIKRANVESVQQLWEVMTTMIKLRVLFVSLDLIPDIGSYLLPNLRAIDLEDEDIDVQTIWKFLSQMHSLQICRLDRKYNILSREVKVLNCSDFLLSCPDITHLHISGVRVIMPTDPSCYVNLKQVVLDDPYHLVLQENLANALVHSKRLNSLIVRAASCDVKAVTILANSPSVQVLDIYTSQVSGGFTTEGAERKAKVLCSTIRRRRKSNGRPINLTFTIGTMDHAEIEQSMYWFPRIWKA